MEFASRESRCANASGVGRDRRGSESGSARTHATAECRCATVEVGRLVLHERVQQRTAEHFEDAPPHRGETVEMVRSVSHEQVQQRTAEQTEDAPQSPTEVVEAVEVTEVTETSSQDLWLRTLEQFLDETWHESLSRFPERVVRKEFFGAGHSCVEGLHSFHCEH